MNEIVGQQDLLYELGGDDALRREKARHPRKIIEPPPEFISYLRENSSDAWYMIVACPGCGRFDSRRSLRAGHGVTFSEAWEPSVPPRAGVNQSNVCSLMSNAALKANVAVELANNNPVFTDWRRQCFQHEHRSRRCLDACWPENAEHWAEIATVVWGSTAWKGEKWEYLMHG